VKNLGFKWYGAYMSLNSASEGTDGTLSGAKSWTFAGKGTNSGTTSMNFQDLSHMTFRRMTDISIGTIETPTGSNTAVNTVADVYIRADRIHF
jgi:hypothetical protein